MTMDYFRQLKRTANGLVLDGTDPLLPTTPAYPSAVPLAEGTVLRVRRASTTGDEAMACVVRDGRGERGDEWCVVTDGGQVLDVDEVTAMVAVQEDGALP